MASAKLRTALLGAACACVLSGPASVQAADEIAFVVPDGSEDLVRSLRAASALLAAETEGRTTNQDYLAAARAEYGALIGALYARGHYGAVISIDVDGREAASIAPLDAPPTINRIVVQVEPGPAYLFSRAAIGPLAPKTELPKGYAVGKVAETGVIRSASRSAVEGWRGVGYAKAAVGDQALVLQHATNRMDAEVTLDPGPRLRFGRLDIAGQDRMREERIRAIAGFPSGEVFDPEALDQTASRLRRAGVFRSVSLAEAETPNADGTLDVHATLVEELPRRFGYGAELSSLDGLDLSAFWMHRNLFGGAERLRFDAAIENVGAQESGVDYRFGVTLERPATFTPDTLVGISANIARLDDEDETIDLATLGLTATHFYSDRVTLRAGVELRAQRVTDLTGDYEFFDLAFPIGTTWDFRDDKFDPTSGFFLSTSTTPFLGFDETDSGVRTLFDARAYRGFGDTRPVVFAGRLQVGSIWGSSLESTPRDYLFFAGGAGSVRGHPFRSLGVNVLDEDQTTGGTRYVALSGEVRAMVTERIGVVGFYDVASVGVDDFVDDPLGGWQAGAGVGVRYKTGFGPIRVDLAAPVGGDTDNGMQLYVGIGQSF